MNMSKFVPPLTVLCCAILGWILYTNLAKFTYSYFLSNYGTTFLVFIIDQQITIFEFMSLILLTDFIIVAFIVFTLAMFNLIIRILSLIIDKVYIVKALSLGAYSTYAVYLFHRPFLICFNFLMLEIFNINMLYKSNFYLTFLSIPMLFLLSFLIQKTADKGILVITDKLRNKNIEKPSRSSE